VNIEEIIVCFDGTTAAEGNVLADNLKRHLGQVAPHVSGKRRRNDGNAQDMGATLVLLLGAPAVVALAKGIADWIRMRPQARLTIRDKAGNVILEIKDAKSSDVRALLEGKLSDVVGR
jgi:hypothetical protein